MIWIGTSGWVYPHWVGHFYPPDLPEHDWLTYYAQYFSTVEINRSFYRLPTFDQFHVWAEQTASHPDFLFAVKASRYITHIKKLIDPQEAITRLLTSASGLGEHLGPFLYQLPPRWRANPERLDQFIALLPHIQRAAFEFRDPSWYQPETFSSLRQILQVSGCALVTAIGGPCPTPLDAPFIGPFRYLRFHHGAYGIGLSDDELLFWAKRLSNGIAEGCDIYAYFNNDADAYAIHNALRFHELFT
ncbi:MAG TPA: DUF72 domain-containing protein [Ktedonobacteraceae bacterium]|nr:DUF72 domain-containing protein [Ktedonobacteraceae bacterium]